MRWLLDTLQTRRLLPKLLAWACVLVALLAAAPAESAGSRRRVYTIAIGHNAVADVLRKNADGLTTLRYADDDALRFYELMRHASQRAFLLSVADADSQRRFPSAARIALAPSLGELERVVQLVSDAISRDLAAGDEPELVFFFSGHGVRDENGGAALSLLDGALTRAWLHERLLARVPARKIHIIIDACHAEAFVRSRDVDARMEPLESADRESYLNALTLERFPNVGAVLASSAAAQSFEWDAYRSGVFAHQLLSALRGAADVNGDGRIEYSEVAAFLAAANLRVKDPRARLEIVVRPPRVDRQAPLLDLTALPGQFELRGRAEGAWARGFFIENERGERLLDSFPERAAAVALRLPIGERLYLIRPDGEVNLGARDGTTVELGSLRIRTAKTRPRGSIDSALRQGLFQARYGPAFYEGYVSQRADFVAVPLSSESLNSDEDARPANATPSMVRRTTGVALLSAGGAAAIVSGTFTALAINAKNEYQDTDLERSAHDAKERFEAYRTAAWISGGVAVGLAAAGVTLLVWPSGEAVARIDGSGVEVVGTF